MTDESRQTIERYKREIIQYIKAVGNEAEVRLLRQAFYDLERLFKDKWRQSGEPMIIHSLRVARLLCQSKEAPQTVIAGLLHDIIEDTSMSYGTIKEQYGTWYADTVESLSKTRNLATTHKKLMRAGERDERTLIIKMFDRLDNMRELEWLTSRKQNRISHETISFYIPIGEKIGIAPEITRELNQLSLSFQA